MSVKVSAWVWEHSKTGGGDRLLLLAIADCADDDGDNAWPSVATLAHKTQTADRTVQRGIERLEAAGCLQVTRGAGRGGTHRYRVLMTPEAAKPQPTEPFDDGGQPVGNPAESVDNPSEGGVNLTPVNLSEGVTQLCHRGGDTAVSPERPERPEVPPNPPQRRGARCTHGRRSCRRCGTSPRRAAAAQDADDAGQLERARAAVPWCGHYLCHRQTRNRITDDGRTVACPDCHPDLVVGPAPPARPALAIAAPRF